MWKIYIVLFLMLGICFSCGWQLKADADVDGQCDIVIERFDQIETHYLSTGDRSALQQMQTIYPAQTRLLIEDMLCIGRVNEADINHRFRQFFSDTTLQCLLRDVENEFSVMSDVEQELRSAFGRLQKVLPQVPTPQFYAQIGSFDQSIVVDGDRVGVSLDKYLGSDYPFYVSHYGKAERRMMTRRMIVPDCIAFYVLSRYPAVQTDRSALERDVRRGKIQWVANQLVGRRAFSNRQVAMVEQYMKSHRHLSMEQLLLSRDVLQ